MLKINIIHFNLKNNEYYNVINENDHFDKNEPERIVQIKSTNENHEFNYKSHETNYETEKNIKKFHESNYETEKNIEKTDY